MRAFLSGPWQRKQVSEKIGRMSRLKLTAVLSSAEALRFALKAIAVSAAQIKISAFVA